MSNVEPTLLTAEADWPKHPPEFSVLDGPMPELIGGSVGARVAAIEPGQLAVWVERLANLGVSASRVTSPDLSGQLSDALSQPIDSIFCSALDTGAATCVQSATAARFPAEVAAGAGMLARMLGVESVSILVDAATPAGWFTELRKLAGDCRVGVIDIINPYPQSDPTLLTFSLTHRRLRPGTLPTHRGVLLFDAVASFAMGRALLSRERVTHEPMAIRQHSTGRSRFVLAPTELTLGRLLDRASMTGGGFVRAGDLLRDRRVSLDTKMVGGERVLHICPTEPPINPDPCTRCGWCVDICPTRVHPATALQAAQENDPVLAKHAGIGACIECGTCTFVCPSRLPLLKAIRMMKSG